MKKNTLASTMYPWSKCQTGIMVVRHGCGGWGGGVLGLQICADARQKDLKQCVLFSIKTAHFAVLSGKVLFSLSFDFDYPEQWCFFFFFFFFFSITT